MFTSNTDKLVKRLDVMLQRMMLTDGEASKDELEFYRRYEFPSYSTPMIIPHTENYKEALESVDTNDVVCDMGAGDLRFALMLAEKCLKVYAVELNPIVVSGALKVIGYKIPTNIIVSCCHWNLFTIPKDVTKIMCLVQIDHKNLPRWWFDNNRKVFLGRVGPEKPYVMEVF